ncbi:hypothetical protein AKJ16_DCAP08901 [Drosera capensis]
MIYLVRRRIWSRSDHQRRLPAHVMFPRPPTSPDAASIELTNHHLESPLPIFVRPRCGHHRSSPRHATSHKVVNDLPRLWQVDFGQPQAVFDLARRYERAGLSLRLICEFPDSKV